MCWGCAVYKITEKRSCWKCGAEKITSENHLVKDMQVREYIKDNIRNTQVECLKDPFSPDSVSSKDDNNNSDISEDAEILSSTKADISRSTENLLSSNEGSSEDITQFIVDHSLEDGEAENENDKMSYRSFTQGKDGIRILGTNNPLFLVYL